MVAFVTVDHGILCQKLTALGVDASEWRWFEGNLRGRLQRVKYNGVLSHSRCAVQSTTREPSGTGIVPGPSP